MIAAASLWPAHRLRSQDLHQSWATVMCALPTWCTCMHSLTLFSLSSQPSMLIWCKAIAAVASMMRKLRTRSILFLFFLISRTLTVLHFTMGTGQDRAYSALEVVPHQCVHQINQRDKPLPTDLGKQVIPHEGKQLFLDDGKEHMVDDGGIQSVATPDSYEHDFSDHQIQVHRPSRKKWILSGGAVGLIVIIAVVLGLVFGLRHKRSGTTPVTSAPNSSATSPPTPLPQRNIAALSFASDSVNNTRVYFQDNMGQIMEAAKSAKDTKWSIIGTGTVGKNGSAIAAAVSRPDFPLVSDVPYTNEVLQICP